MTLRDTEIETKSRWFFMDIYGILSLVGNLGDGKGAVQLSFTGKPTTLNLHSTSWHISLTSTAPSLRETT